MKKPIVQIEKIKQNPIFTDQFIQLQLRDIELRKSEHDAKKAQNAKLLEFARNTFEIQTEEMKSKRENDRKRDRHFLNILMVVVILFFSLMIIAMALNKDALLIEISKIAGYVFGGGITGYGLAMQKAKPKLKDETAVPASSGNTLIN